MRPQAITFHVYAETDEEAKALQDALYDFVISQYSKGVLVTAARLTDALKRYGKNPIITNYLK